MDQTLERWLPVVGYEGFYEVSDHGRVRSVERMIQCTGPCRSFIKRAPSRLFTPARSGKNGKYKRVLLRNPDRQHCIHRLVLAAFIGPRPDGCEARHLDGDPANNKLSNLAWGTKAENEADKTRHGTLLVGENNPASKLTADDVRTIRASGAKQSELAAIHGVSQPVISSVKRRETWRHV